MTFSTQPGDIPHELTIDSTGLHGTSVSSNTIHIQVGSNYVNYNFVEITDLTSGPYTFTIENLTPDTPVYARVSPYNDLGYGKATTSLPRLLAAPKQKPSIPLRGQVSVGSSTSLRVLWHAPDSDGGDTVTKYKIEWDPKATFDSASQGLALGSDVINVSPNACDPLPCEFLIGSLSKGTPYYVRIYAYNTYGYSVDAALTTPRFETPRTQPKPPVSVTLTEESDSSIRVDFEKSPDDGGAPVTKYKIEWDVAHEASYMNGATSDNILYSPTAVQHIETQSSANDLGGSFRLKFEDFETDALAYDISSDDMKTALESLPTIGTVNISRHAVDPVRPRNGLRWTISFLTNVGNIQALLVSTDDGETYATISRGKPTYWYKH